MDYNRLNDYLNRKLEEFKVKEEEIRTKEIEPLKHGDKSQYVEGQKKLYTFYGYYKKYFYFVCPEPYSTIVFEQYLNFILVLRESLIRTKRPNLRLWNDLVELQISVKLDKFEYEQEAKLSKYTTIGMIRYKEIMSASDLYKFRLGIRDLKTIRNKKSYLRVVN